MHTTGRKGQTACKIDFKSGSCSGSRNNLVYNCDTEGGSSGSPVIARHTHKVVGLHHCGGGCSGNLGVRMSAIYPEVARFVYGDNPNWYYRYAKKKRVRCDWVARLPGKRCNFSGKIGSTVVKADAACRESCAPKASICRDNPDWYYGKTKRVRCNWVARNRRKRCNINGKIGNTTRMKAGVACLESCGHC
jgi:hypothetical protein